MRIERLQNDELAIIRMLGIMGFRYVLKEMIGIVALKEKPSITGNNEGCFVEANNLFNFMQAGHVYEIKKREV